MRGRLGELLYIGAQCVGVVCVARIAVVRKITFIGEFGESQNSYTRWRIQMD